MILAGSAALAKKMVNLYLYGQHYIVISHETELMCREFRKAGRKGGQGIQALPGQDKRESFDFRRSLKKSINDESK